MFAATDAEAVRCAGIVQPGQPICAETLQQLQHAWHPEMGLVQGGAWISINSDARGPADKKVENTFTSWPKRKGGSPIAVVLDGARATPHLVVINPQGRHS